MTQNLQRLFVETALSPDAGIPCRADQANYLGNVLRLGVGDSVLVFDGAHGEWRAEIVEARKGHWRMRACEQVRAQADGPDLHYLFAPLKRGRLDYLVQKATELGAAALRPVMTRRTVPGRVKVDRMRSNAIEAAEQCGVLRLPSVHEPEKLTAVLDRWDPDRKLIYCDEAAEVASPVAALSAIDAGAPLAVLCGPEGGFDEEERRLLSGHPSVLAISLGPRVMRADTAAVAALALVNAVLGDWR